MRALNRFRQRYIKPWGDPLKYQLRQVRPWRVVNLGGIDVHYKRHLHGGGMLFGQGYVPLLQGLGMPKVPRVFEWCAGPGFIGFSILGHGLCESLCLADINPEAVDACQRTIRANNLSDRVSVYHSDNLKSIPPSERWDLVVSNPPHSVDGYLGDIRGHDPDWRIHREFYETVGQFLKPGGIIILQEQNTESTAETFRPMIEKAGLNVEFAIGGEPQRTSRSRLYFVGITRPGDPRPAWTLGPGSR